MIDNFLSNELYIRTITATRSLRSLICFPIVSPHALTWGSHSGGQTRARMRIRCMRCVLSAKYKIFINMKSQEVGVLRMYFDMRAVILRATEDYSRENMVGEIGGYAALLLGTAVIDLVRNTSFHILTLFSWQQSVDFLPSPGHEDGLHCVKDARCF